MGGKGRAIGDYHAPAFRALSERGEDIGRGGVLLRLAADSGLDCAGLRAALGRREFEAGVVADEREAAGLGASGVPAFVAGSSGQNACTFRFVISSSRGQDSSAKHGLIVPEGF